MSTLRAPSRKRPSKRSPSRRGEEQLEVLLLAVVGRGGHQQEVPRAAGEQLAQAVALGVLDFAAEEAGGHLVRFVAHHQVVAAVRRGQQGLHLCAAGQLVQPGDGQVVFQEPVAGAGSLMRGAGPSRSPAEGSFMRRAGPSRSPAEGSFMRGTGPSRSPAEGFFMRGASPSRSPAEGSIHLVVGENVEGQPKAAVQFVLPLLGQAAGVRRPGSAASRRGRSAPSSAARP